MSLWTKWTKEGKRNRGVQWLAQVNSRARNRPSIYQYTALPLRAPLPAPTDLIASLSFQGTSCCLVFEEGTGCVRLWCPLQRSGPVSTQPPSVWLMPWEPVASSSPYSQETTMTWLVAEPCTGMQGVGEASHMLPFPCTAARSWTRSVNQGHQKLSCFSW